MIQAAAAASGRLAGHCSVVYDGIVAWFLPAFLRASGLKHLHYAMLFPSLPVCLERVRSGKTHGFDDRDAAERTWYEFHRAEVDSRHGLFDQSIEPETAQTVADRVKKRTIRYP